MAADVGVVEAPPYEYAVVGDATLVTEEPFDDFDELPHAPAKTTARTTSGKLNLRVIAILQGADLAGLLADSPSRDELACQESVSVEWWEFCRRILDPTRRRFVAEQHTIPSSVIAVLLVIGLLGFIALLLWANQAG